MTTTNELDRALEDWFAADAAAPAPAGLLDRVTPVTARRRPRPGWLAGVRGHWVGGDVAAGASGASRLSRRLALMATVALLIALLAGAALVGSGLLTPSPVPPIPPERGAFTPTGRPIADRDDSYTATLLDDGRVLVVGGYRSQDTAEVWEPATETFRSTGTLATPQYGHTATLLDDGRVLILGGSCDECPDGLVAAQVWDPSTDSFTPTTNVPSADALWGTPGTGFLRRSPLVLDDGRVLVGRGPAAEVFEPETGTFGPAGALGDTADTPYGVRLADGRVLSRRGDGMAVWTPETGDFAPTGPLLEHRDLDNAVLLRDGRVLFAGGEGEPVGQGSLKGVPRLASAEIWDPTSGRSSATGPMTRAAYHSTPTLLPDGRVLVVLPADGESPASAELFELK